MHDNCKATLVIMVEHTATFLIAFQRIIVFLVWKKSEKFPPNISAWWSIKCICLVAFNYFDDLASDTNKFKFPFKETPSIKGDQYQLKPSIYSCYDCDRTSLCTETLLWKY